MNTPQLTIEQLETLRTRAESDLKYFAQLVQRMRSVGFSADDPLRRQAERVHSELQGWRMALHYRVVDAKRHEG